MLASDYNYRGALDMHEIGSSVSSILRFKILLAFEPMETVTAQSVSTRTLHWAVKKVILAGGTLQIGHHSQRSYTNS